jgi:protoheme IX farnesyltransferase
MMVGLALIIGSACVINCIMDRGLDAKMERTKKRPLPMKKISIQNAVIYGTILFVLGSIVLLALVNVIAWVWAVVGFVTYTALYGYVKRHSWTGTMVGTIPGATPVLVGYAAVDPTLPVSAWLLFIALLFWQLPHFYALALYRKDDYAKSGLPMMTVIKSREFVMKHIIATAILYVVATISLVVFSPLPKAATGLFAAAATAWVCVILLAKQRGTDAWARKTFGTSLYMPMVMLASGVVAVAVA